SYFIAPVHELLKIAGNFRRYGRDSFAVYSAGGTVKRNPIAKIIFFAVKLEISFFLVNLKRLASGDAAFPHSAGDNRRVGSHAAAGREEALGNVHSFDVFRRGLEPYQNHFLAFLGIFKRL